MVAAVIAIGTIALCLLGLLMWMMRSTEATRTSTTTTLTEMMKDQAAGFQSILTSISATMTRMVDQTRSSFDRAQAQQNQLLTRVLAPNQQETSSDSPPPGLLSFEQELELAPPSIRAQMIREKMETESRASQDLVPIRGFDPRVPIVDPNADPREAVIWSPPTLETNGSMHISRAMSGDLDDVLGDRG